MLRRAMAGIGFSVLAFGLIPLLAWAAGAAKPGMVVTKDNPPHTWIGDVDETTAPGKVEINSAQGKVLLDSRNVEKITYFNSPAEEFAGRVSALDRKDVAARVELAKFAVANNMYPEARQLLVAALVIEPANSAAADLLRQVDEKIKAAHPPETAPVAPPVDANAPPAKPGSVRARRTLTPDEINFIRQNEWTEADTDLRVQVAPEGLRGALALGLVDPDAVRNMTPAQIGWEIVKRGPPGLRKDVKIASDPGFLLTYRTHVQKFVITSCATGACHNTDKGGNFYLYTEPLQSDATVVTDYMILQQYVKTIKGIEYQMIDRLHPENSLLLQFALPPNLAAIPHPKAAGYVPPTKRPFLLNQVKEWIRSLPAVAPTYDIDLSKPPPTTKPAAG